MEGDDADDAAETRFVAVFDAADGGDAEGDDSEDDNEDDVLGDEAGYKDLAEEAAAVATLGSVE